MKDDLGKRICNTPNTMNGIMTAKAGQIGRLRSWSIANNVPAIVVSSVKQSSMQTTT